MCYSCVYCLLSLSGEKTGGEAWSGAQILEYGYILNAQIIKLIIDISNKV